MRDLPGMTFVCRCRDAEPVPCLKDVHGSGRVHRAPCPHKTLMVSRRINFIQRPQGQRLAIGQFQTDLAVFDIRKRYSTIFGSLVSKLQSVRRNGDQRRHVTIITQLGLTLAVIAEVHKIISVRFDPRAPFQGLESKHGIKLGAAL